MSKRDADLETEDAVAVIARHLRYRSACYVFETNVLGSASTTGCIADDGVTTDTDLGWRLAVVRAGRTEAGWSAEIAIEL